MFEAYRIGVRISLINHATAGLAALSGHFLKTEAEAAKLQKRLDSIQSQALKGAAMLGAGVAGLSLFKAPYEEAKALAQAQASFSTLNLSAIDNQKAYAQATALAHQRLGSTITDNIKLIQDLHTATGDLPKALALSDAYTQFSVAAKIQNGGKSVDSLVMNSIKALEHRGDRVVQNPETLNAELAAQSRVYFATAGRVSPSDYFHASQTGKMAYQLMGSDFLYGPYAAYMQSRTGPTAGTAAMTSMSSLVGGHMTKKAIGFLRGLGLWEDQASPLLKGMRGSLEKSIASDPELKRLIASNGDLMVQSGGLPGQAAQLYAADPQSFVQKMLIPAIRKKYGSITDEQVAELLTGQFNRNTADFLSFWVTSDQKATKDASLIRKSQSFSDAYQTFIKSPGGSEEALSAAWTNFLAIFGTVYLPQITKGLTWLAGTIDSLSKTVERHPTAFKIVADGLMLIFGALALGGTLKIASAGLDGLGLAIGGLKKVATDGLITNLNNTSLGLKAVGAAAAWFVGQYVGEKASQFLDSVAKDRGDKDDTVGSVAYDYTNPFNAKTGRREHDWKRELKYQLGGVWAVDKDELATDRKAEADAISGSPYVRTKPAAKPGGSIGDVYIDGKKLGKVMAPHLADQLSSPQRGSNSFDFTATPAPVGLTTAR